MNGDRTTCGSVADGRRGNWEAFKLPLAGAALARGELELRLQRLPTFSYCFDAKIVLLAHGLYRLINAAALLPTMNDFKCNKKVPMPIHAALRAFKLKNATLSLRGELN